MADDIENTAADDRETIVSRERFDQVYSQRKEALARVKALEGQLAEMQPKVETLGSLEKTIEEMKASHAKALGDWESEKAVLSTGITDPEALDVAKLFYAKLPADDKRPTMAAWLTDLKADPTKAPRSLQPYFQGAESAPAKTAAKVDPAATTAQPQGKPLPVPNAQVQGSAAGAAASVASVDAARLKAANERARQTGDTSELRELMTRLKKA